MPEQPDEETTGKQDPAAKELKREFHIFEIIALCVNLILAITGIGVLYVYHGQLNVMQGQLDQMKNSSTQTDALIREASKQSKAATDAAAIAHDALKLSRDQFREDQRPYITLGPAGSSGRIELVASGDHMGHISVELSLANYGKSPGVEIARDARLAVGSTDGRQIRWHKAPDQRGRIIPPGDKPSIYAYSDGPIDQKTFSDIIAGKVLLIAYGHVEYTDLLAEPRPVYSSDFCTGMIFGPRTNTQEADSDCKDHTYMK